MDQCGRQARTPAHACKSNEGVAEETLESLSGIKSHIQTYKHWLHEGSNMVYCKVCEGEVEAHQEEPSGYT